MRPQKDEINVGFGVDQLTQPTPQRASIAFNVGFGICKMLTAYVAATTLIPKGLKYEFTILITLLLEPSLLVVSKMFGVEIDPAMLLKRQHEIEQREHEYLQHVNDKAPDNIPDNTSHTQTTNMQEDRLVWVPLENKTDTVNYLDDADQPVNKTAVDFVTSVNDPAKAYIEYEDSEVYKPNLVFLSDVDLPANASINGSAAPIAIIFGGHSPHRPY